MAAQILILSLLAIALIVTCNSEVLCIKDNACKCTLDDGTKRYFDLSEISSENVPYFQVGAPGRIDYYDPCEPFTITDSGNVCNGVAGCHLEVGGEQQTYSNIAKHNRVVFDYNEAGENLVLNYDNDDNGNLITLSVVLICVTDTQDVLEIEDYTPTSYRYLLLSPYGCLQDSGGNRMNNGWSARSILAIIFCVCFNFFIL